jgi:hypothetical protein
MIALSSKVIDGPMGCFLRAAYRKDGLLENPGWRAINALGLGVHAKTLRLSSKLARSKL